VSLLKLSKALNKGGDVFQKVLNDNYYYFCPSRGTRMRTPVLVGRYRTAPLSGERSVLLGNLKSGITAGL
jgi:hypothetical protein